MYDIFDKWIYLNFCFWQVSGTGPWPRGRMSAFKLCVWCGRNTNSVIYGFKCTLLSAFRGQLMAVRARSRVFVLPGFGHCLWPAHFLLQYVALANNAIACSGPVPEQIALHKLCECQKVFGDWNTPPQSPVQATHAVNPWPQSKQIELNMGNMELG